MKTDMRRVLAREAYEKKIQKVEQLLRLVREFPRQLTTSVSETRAATACKVAPKAQRTIRTRSRIEAQRRGLPMFIRKNGKVQRSSRVNTLFQSPGPLICVNT
jgi:hypothetical protein